MNINSIFYEFAKAFVGTVISESDIAYPKKLCREKLDFTLESLGIVDRYFEHIHRKRRKIGYQEMDNTMLWGGAYLGEVIRKIAKKEYQWIEHKDLIIKHPDLESVVPYSYGTRALLISNDGSLTMPVNKVVRLVEDGLENNLQFYAAGER